MLPYLYIFPTKEEETQKYLDYLKGYVSQILKHIYGDLVLSLYVFVELLLCIQTE
jgi:hypothetical protein